MAADVLLFDIGGVLVDWRGPDELARLTEPRLESPEVRRRLSTSRAVRHYETGGCDGLEFAARFVEEWPLALAPEVFLERFDSWLGVPYPGVLEGLAALRQRHRLACLSNTNAQHWARLTGELGLGQVLDHCYGSHLLQVAKPDPQAFRLVLEDLAVAPSDVVFFDDGPANVAAAAALGIESHLVDPSRGVGPKLRELGLL